MQKTGLIIGVLVLLLVWTSTALGAGVRPLVIDLDLKPGEQAEFEIALTPGAKEEIVHLSLYQPIQILNGSLTYEVADPTIFPVTNWITLESNAVKVLPGADTTVKGTVQVPFSAGGSQTVIIMVEPQASITQQGVTFRVRYAVRLNIRVDRPGLRSTAELTMFQLTSGEELEPVVRVRIKNPSVWDYLVSGEVTIRDEQRRLVERISIAAEASASSGSDKLRVYPGYEVELTGDVTRRLIPGEYQIRGFFRYGDHGQIIQNKTIVISEGDFNFTTGNLGVFSVEPTAFKFELRAGERRSQVLQVQSEVGETVQILVEASDVQPQYPYSLLNLIELRSTEFQLAGRSRLRAAFTLAVPREVENGSYHGNLVLKAVSLDTGDFISEQIVPISLVIGEDHDCMVEVRSLAAQLIEGEGHWLSLDLYNSGNALVTPTVSLVIYDMEDAFVQRAILELSDGVSYIIPLESQQFETMIPELESGSYRVEIKVETNMEELTAVERILEL